MQPQTHSLNLDYAEYKSLRNNKKKVVKNGSDELDDKINDLSTQFCIIKHDHQHQQQHESSE